MIIVHERMTDIIFSATSHPKVARPLAVASNPETPEPVLLARRADREPSTTNMMKMNLRSK